MMMGIPRSFSFSAYPRRKEYCKTSLTPKIGGYEGNEALRKSFFEPTQEVRTLQYGPLPFLFNVPGTALFRGGFYFTQQVLCYISVRFLRASVTLESRAAQPPTTAIRHKKDLGHFDR